MSQPRTQAFSLVELLVAIAVVAVLVGLLVPSLARARESARAGVCSSNLRQLALANDLYAGDSADRFAPGAPDMLSNLARWHGSRRSPGDEFTPVGGTLVPYLTPGADPGLAASRLVRACPTFARTAERLRAARMGFERSAGGYGYNQAYVGSERTLAGVDPSTHKPVWTLVTDRLGAGRARFSMPAGTIAFADAALADGNREAGVIEYSFVEPRFWPEAPGARTDPSVHFRHAASTTGTRARDGLATIAWLDGHVAGAHLTFSSSSGVYPASPVDFGVGWPGTQDDNTLFEYR